MWGQIGGAVIGGLMGQKTAKDDRKAQAESDRMNNMGYMDAKPYITGGYKQGQDALNNQLNAGYYDGTTYAGMNDMQNTGANNMYNMGSNAYGAANNLMSATGNFGNNYSSLYNRANQDNFGAANNYAMANSDPLVDAQMRGVNRQLNEVSLPGLNNSASASGNMRNSRAGIAEGMLRRSAGETEADIRANTMRDMRNEYLGQTNTDFGNMMNANAGMANANQTGFNMGNTASGNMMNAGGMFQTDKQNQYNDNRNRFDGVRDFASNKISGFMSGIMGRAPTTPANHSPNYHNPMMSGLAGMQSGFGMMSPSGMGGQISDFFSNRGQQRQQQTPYVNNRAIPQGVYT